MIAVLLALVLLGVSYDALQSALDKRRYPPPGTLVDVGGRKLHLHCEGTGATTIVLEAGLGAWSVHMRALQRQLRDSARTCTYDRAGLGWSEPGRQHDVASSAAELRSLVTAAPISRPFVLVGHSLGANIAQVYAAAYGDDLQGLVLIDPGTPPEMLEGVEGDTARAAEVTSCGWKCPAGTAMARLGLVRLAAKAAGTARMTDHENELYRAGVAQAKTVRAMIGSLTMLPRSGVQVAAATRFGDVPVTVLYSDELPKPDKDESPADVEAWKAGWLGRMQSLLEGTSRPRGPVRIPNTGHLSIILDSAAVAQVARETLGVASTPARSTALHRTSDQP